MTDFTAPPAFTAPKTAPSAAPKTAPSAAPKAAPSTPPQTAPVGVPPVAATGTPVPPSTPPQTAPVGVPPVAATGTPVPPAPIDAPAAVEVAPDERKKQVRLATKIIGNDEIKFVVQNVATMGYKEMGDKIGLTKHQVNRILQTLKEGLRKSAIDGAGAAGEKAYGERTTKKGDIKADYNSPLTDLAQKVENKILKSLSRPNDSHSGSKGGGKAKQALDSTLDAMLADL